MLAVLLLLVVEEVLEEVEDEGGAAHARQKHPKGDVLAFPLARGVQSLERPREGARLVYFARQEHLSQ